MLAQSIFYVSGCETAKMLKLEIQGWSHAEKELWEINYGVKCHLHILLVSTGERKYLAQKSRLEPSVSTQPGQGFEGEMISDLLYSLRCFCTYHSEHFQKMHSSAAGDKSKELGSLSVEKQISLIVENKNVSLEEKIMSYQEKINISQILSQQVPEISTKFMCSGSPSLLIHLLHCP